MKYIFTCLIFVILIFTGNAQDSLPVRNLFVDTTAKTVIEKQLKQKNVLQKVEYIGGNSIGGTFFSAIVVRNLLSNEVTKGVYVTAATNPSTHVLNVKSIAHGYIDEYELDNLIFFFEQCDQVWKKETPTERTSYEIETTDKLRFTFGTDGQTSSWRYGIQYGDHYFYGADNFGKGRSQGLSELFKLFQKVLRDVGTAAKPNL